MTAERIVEQSGQLEVEFQRFKEREGFTHALGIIGGSSQDHVNRTRTVLADVINRTQQAAGRFAIVSGGTKDGVPEMALNIGRELNLPTVGVFPEAGIKHALLDRIDFPIAVPTPPFADSPWGTETPTLVSIPDAFVLIGGEWGSNIEISTIMKRNVRRVSKGFQPIPVYTIDGSGKLADNLEFLVSIFTTPQGSFYKCETPEQLTMHLTNTFTNLKNT